jgi:hypothetical protein
MLSVLDAAICWNLNGMNCVVQNAAIQKIVKSHPIMEKNRYNKKRGTDK